MSEPKVCCNCLHCARWKKKAGIECHCDLTDRYLGYLDVMEENNCEHWEKETKWDLQKEHDMQIRTKAIDEVIQYISTHRYGWQDLRDFLEQMKGGAEYENIYNKNA